MESRTQRTIPNESPDVITLAEYHSSTFVDGASSDRFFRDNTVGFNPLIVDRPFERFEHYRKLLHGIKNADPIKYKTLHRGTPLFFMAVFCFEMGNFEKALFYLDAAISEDIHTLHGDASWTTLPGAQFLTLDSSTNHIARRVINRLRQMIDAQLVRFNDISNRPPVDLDTWVAEFVRRMLEGPSGRTTLCSLYVFLYEFSDRIEEIEIRGQTPSGSNHPFIAHLFLGSLIWESLLKQFYKGPTTLDQIFKHPQFAIDFELQGQRLKVDATTLQGVVDRITGNDVICAFETAARIRNLTGHGLERDNVFDTPERYTQLFNQVVNAIFNVIAVKFLSPVQDIR